MARKNQQFSPPNDVEMRSGVRRSWQPPPGNESSIPTRKELEAIVAEARAAREAEAQEAARAEAQKRAAQQAKAGRVRGSKKRARVEDGRVGRYRANSDRIEEFELRLLRHGVNFDEIEKYAKQYDAGTRTPLAKLAHAVLDWWCSASISHMRIIWVDPISGFTEETVPKLSSLEGQSLVARGLAGGVWVSTRRQLLQARQWKAHMLSLTPVQRITEPMVFGDLRLGAKNDTE